MSVELISVLVAMLAIGVTLAGGLILTSSRGLRQDIKDLRGEVGELRERMAKLKGLLEGLREAISGAGEVQLGRERPEATPRSAVWLGYIFR